MHSNLIEAPPQKRIDGIYEEGPAVVIVVGPPMLVLYIRFLTGCAITSNVERFYEYDKRYKRIVVLQPGNEDDFSQLYSDENIIFVTYSESTWPILVVKEIAEIIKEWKL